MPKLSKKELCELCELDALCFPEPINYPYGVMKGFLKQEGALLLRERYEEKVVGFCLGNWRSGQIITIDVHPKCRRKGIGRRLLSETLRILREKGCRRIYSNVALNNVPSLQLHIRHGFKINRIVPNYYADGTAAYLLTLEAHKEITSR
jgi:ribosomal-protein-alanine N-acetyltransferase